MVGPLALSMQGPGAAVTFDVEPSVPPPPSGAPSEPNAPPPSAMLPNPDYLDDLGPVGGASVSDLGCLSGPVSSASASASALGSLFSSPCLFPVAVPVALSLPPSPSRSFSLARARARSRSLALALLFTLHRECSAALF